MATILNVGLNRAGQVIMDDVSHTAVGSGTTAEAVTDTTLATETDRLAPTSSKRQSNLVIIRTFFANANLPSTTEEIGWFMNGSGAADSGELLVRALSTFVKGSQDLNVVLQLTIDRA
jgi:hypothetical protein|tara:strand:+ start:3607 stop:3960 length:354 start_codon:yes stop_codon:yes gene_type:complete